MTEPIKEQKTIKDFKEIEIKEEAMELDDLIGVIETVSVEPTGNITKFSQQLKIYKNDTTRRLYWYDTTNQEWVYVGGTAV